MTIYLTSEVGKGRAVNLIATAQAEYYHGGYLLYSRTIFCHNPQSVNGDCISGKIRSPFLMMYRALMSPKFTNSYRRLLGN
jgi:hypothetical protein